MMDGPRRSAAFVGFMFGLTLGIFSSLAGVEVGKAEAFEKGKASGWAAAIEQCNAPSRLERAAKWVTQ